MFDERLVMQIVGAAIGGTLIDLSLRKAGKEQLALLVDLVLTVGVAAYVYLKAVKPVIEEVFRAFGGYL